MNEALLKRAENIVGIVKSGASVQQIATILKDVEVGAIEACAEELQKQANSFMNADEPNPAGYNLCMAQMRNIRTLKAR